MLGTQFTREYRVEGRVGCGRCHSGVTGAKGGRRERGREHARAREGAHRLDQFLLFGDSLVPLLGLATLISEPRHEIGHSQY